MVADWLFVGRGFAQRDVAGGPILRDLAGVDFVSQIAVEDTIGPDGRA